MRLIKLNNVSVYIDEKSEIKKGDLQYYFGQPLTHTISVSENDFPLDGKRAKVDRIIIKNKINNNDTIRSQIRM